MEFLFSETNRGMMGNDTGLSILHEHEHFSTFYGLNRVYMYIVLDTETNLPHQNYISKIHLPMLVMELIIFSEKSNIFYA